MKNIQNGVPAVSQSNGATGPQSQENAIRELQAECERLRLALANAEMERDNYRMAYIEQARERREFEDLDIESLQAMSARPVELIHAE